MPNIIRIKRRASGSTGAPSSLASAELAFNEVDNTLYYGKGDSGGNATSIAAIGGEGAFVTVAGASNQTISGQKTFSGTVALGSSATATTPSTSDDSTKVATTAYVKAQGFTGNTGTVTSVGLSVPATLFDTPTGTPVTTSGTISVALATQAQYAVLAGPTSASPAAPTFRSLTAGDIPTLTAAKISDFDTQVRTSRLDQMAAPTADVALNNRKITGLADPVNAQDAATKAFVESVAQGLDAKASVRCATTANITLSGTQTIDTVAVVANDRVLVKNQSTASQNGIYIASGSGWTRATDADTWNELVSAFVFVEEGGQADNGFVCLANAGGTLGTSDVTWTQFSGAGQITVGTGLTKNGNQIDLDATLAGISAVTTAPDQLIYSNGTDTFATTGLTGAGRAILDDADASAQRTTLGLAIGTNVQAWHNNLQELSALGNMGPDRLVYTGPTGTGGATTFTTTAITSTARSLLDDTSTTVMRSTLGLTIGTNVQAYDAGLQSISGLTTAADRMIYTTASDTYAVTTLTPLARTLLAGATESDMRGTLFLGTIATQAANSVSITGGSIDNITIDGGSF